MVQNRDQERERRRGSFGFCLSGEEQILIHNTCVFSAMLSKNHFNLEPSYDIFSVLDSIQYLINCDFNDRIFSLNIVIEISATLVQGGCRISLIESQ